MIFPTVARVRDAFRRGTLHWLLPIHRCHSGRIGRKSKGCWGNGRYGQHLRSALSLVVRPFPSLLWRRYGHSMGCDRGG